MFVAGLFSEEDEIVCGRGGESEGVFEVGGEIIEALWRGVILRGGGEFDVGIEPVEVGAAAAGGLIAFDGGNEVLVHSGLAASFLVKRRHAFGPDGGEGEVELLVPGIPIRLGVLFPTTQPFKAVSDVCDFVFVNLGEKVGGFLIARLSEDL